MEMEKTFNPQAVESEIYRDWESSGAFEAHRVEGKKPFTIVMPPPNITGQLHMGHALDCTLQDLAVRYHRMKGDPTLWLPGTDHAAIATEVKIVDAMRKEGLTKESLGRKGFLDRAWKWKEEYGGRIVTQQRRMGISCDWSRERFTMDEGCSKAVRPPVRKGADLPRQPAGQLVPVLRERDFGRGSGISGERRQFLASAVPCEGDGRDAGTGDHPPRNHARRHCRGD